MSKQSRKNFAALQATRAQEPPPQTHAEGSRIEIHPGFYAQVVLITPELAEHWLKRNHKDNRAIGEKTVEAMARDQSEGRWRLTHQAIAFNGDEELIDGQHRLSAVVMSRTPVKMLVVWNDESQLMDPIDRIRPRSLGFITGQRTNVIAALGCLRSLEVGYEIQSSLTVADVEEAISKFGEDIKFVLDNISGSHRIVGGALAACVWGLPLNKEAVLEFGHKVASGEMIQHGDPAFAFRSWKERNKGMSTWNIAMAAMNCLRFQMFHVTLRAVYTGTTGYRGLTTQRRVMKLPHTPPHSLVESYTNPPSKDQKE